ncbi:MAG: endolytic transglycosylase MltG, partial [Eubacteriales bacterium]|nr:endolytic transglycosylase MltG [Eubacteriales bacterium]
LYEDGGIKISKNSKENQEVILSIPEGAGLKTISNTLKEEGIIESDLFFRLKCKEMGIDTNFKPGEFTLNKNMDFFEIIEVLQTAQGDDTQVKFLIKEGETQEDIGKNLEENGIISYNEFMEACNTLTFDYEFLKEMPIKEERTSKLEGYLYPDTYFIKKGESAESIINKFLKRFDELYTDEMRKLTKEKGLTIDEVVIMASIIEKEIKYAPERKIAASVIFNRIEQGMPLQMDATVLYAKKEHSDRTTIADTKIESPYNTYYVKGLPIGPISNPRIDCIEAVLNPEKTNYIYYVVKDDNTGEHFYTEDYNEFLSAKEKYLKKFD